MAASLGSKIFSKFSHFSVQNSSCLSTSSVQFGKKNFRKFLAYNKRGSNEFRSNTLRRRELGLFHDLGVRQTGVIDRGSYRRIPEMIPELIVPDLTGFKLKPYVSYRVPDVVQTEFMAQDLFDACYASKIAKDFQNGKLDENGMSLEPSADELRTPQVSLLKAKQTGTDMLYQKLDLPDEMN